LSFFGFNEIGSIGGERGEEDGEDEEEGEEASSDPSYLSSWDEKVSKEVSSGG